MIKLSGTFVIKNRQGWHARPCSRITRLIKLHPNITVIFEKLGCTCEPASGNSIFELMKLGLNYKDDVRYILQGNDESEIRALSKDLLALNEQMADEESEAIF